MSASGQLLHCPPPTAAAMIPAGAKDNAVVTTPVRDLAALVDTRTWTSSGGNTFPGADVPFGMVQWSPDTMPHRSAGGGYTYGDPRLSGYSLTHLSGPGCPSAGDVPILPMTGPEPTVHPSAVTTSFTNAGEVAQAGYYQASSNLPATITSRFSATAHSAIGQFTFPRTRAADFLIKLRDSEYGESAASAAILSRDEITGSVTSGNFCYETSRYGPQRYTLHFDILFSRPATSARIITEPGARYPSAVFLTFDTRSDPMVTAKVAISYVSAANARLDLRAEGWNLAGVRAAARAAWDKLLGEITVTGGGYARTQEFYSLLYKCFIQPNITSDVNGQFLGSDRKVHTLRRGQANQYGMFSGWDIYHSLAQLQAMLDPGAASDMAQSLVSYYAENGILPQWGYLNLDNYAMVGDPADAVIADYYAFGAAGFDRAAALADMLRQASTANRVRPGEAAEARYGYLPQDLAYGCCRMHGYVAALLEYDTADFALSRYAAAMGDQAAATWLQRRANNWTKLFDASDRLLTPRYTGGGFVAGVTPTTARYYVEGDAAEYLWDVPNNYAGLIARLGGGAQAAAMLRQYLSKPDGRGIYAHLLNEFDFGEQNAADYAGDPAGTQLAVATIRTDLYRPGPSGLRGNEDLGATSSQFIWEMLGLYPENPGSGTLVFASPGFPAAVITLPSGKTITISAPGACAATFYVSSLLLNGAAYSLLYVPFATLAQGARLDWTLADTPSSWGSAPQDAPPSYGMTFQP